MSLYKFCLESLNQTHVSGVKKYYIQVINPNHIQLLFGTCTQAALLYYCSLKIWNNDKNTCHLKSEFALGNFFFFFLISHS